MIKNTKASYGSITKFLHWLLFFLIFIMLVVGFFMDDIHDKAIKGVVFNLHKLTGITILALMILRAVWALMNPKPDLPPGTLPWQRLAERSVHFMIYAALIAMPISGWVMSTAAGYSPHIFGFDLVFPVAKDKALSDMGFMVHQYLAWFIIFLISIHAAAAFYHYLVKKDGVLQRML